MRTLLTLLLLCLSEIAIPKVKKSEWTGIASFYSLKFHGRRTASGETYSKSKFTAANNFLKFGTMVKVTNLKNKQWVMVKINDRLHARNKRLIDLSYAAAQQLDFMKQGTCRVKMELVSQQPEVPENTNLQDRE